MGSNFAPELKRLLLRRVVDSSGMARVITKSGRHRTLVFAFLSITRSNRDILPTPFSSKQVCPSIFDACHYGRL